MDVSFLEAGVFDFENADNPEVTLERREAELGHREQRIRVREEKLVERERDLAAAQNKFEERWGQVGHVSSLEAFERTVAVLERLDKLQVAHNQQIDALQARVVVLEDREERRHAEEMAREMPCSELFEILRAEAVTKAGKVRVEVRKVAEKYSTHEQGYFWIMLPYDGYVGRNS